MLLRTCLACGQTDDHPRHEHLAADGQTWLPWHFDCHALTGCESCAAQIAGANGAKGDALRAYLETTGPGADQPGWTAPVEG